MHETKQIVQALYNILNWPGCVWPKLLKPKAPLDWAGCAGWKGVEMDGCRYKSQTKVSESQNAVQTWAFIISQWKSTIHAYIIQRKLENGQKYAKLKHKYPKVN